MIDVAVRAFFVLSVVVYVGLIGLLAASDLGLFQ